jgi:hypothetical protein
MLLLALAGSGIAWLARDPVPYFMERRRADITASRQLIDSANGHVTERIRIGASNGLDVDLTLRRPIDSGVVHRRPVFLLLGGYRTGDRAATLVADTRGNILVALAYPYRGDLDVKGLAVVAAVPALRKAILDTPPAVMLVIDYLLSRPDVDSSRVELVGASFGAPFATVVGALDPRVTRVWSVHGAASPYDQFELNLRRQIGNRAARHAVAGLATLFASGWQLDPAVWAPRISPRPFIMVNARADERMPPEAVRALHEAARPPRDVIWLDGAHIQTNRKQVLAGLVETVLQRAASP